MFAKYVEVRIAWLSTFILSIVSTFGAIWMAYLESEWKMLVLGFFFTVVILFLVAGISERKAKPSNYYVNRGKQ